jgi:hypothetical protein
VIGAGDAWRAAQGCCFPDSSTNRVGRWRRDVGFATSPAPRRYLVRIHMIFAHLKRWHGRCNP